MLDGEKTGGSRRGCWTAGQRGLHRVLCEGGPHLFGSLLGADAADELCLTLAPTLAGGAAGRIYRRR